MKTPHLVQYQGSKRIIAPEIVKFFPTTFDRLIEPFAGTCAITILSAAQGLCDEFWINDINQPLVNLMEECINNPLKLIEYENIWNGQFAEGENNIDYFYKIREEFNKGKKDSARMLFLLARVVKGAVRYNSNGELNQSCDKRRYGTKPNVIANNALAISGLLKDKASFSNLDYKDVLSRAQKGDLVYMDPPYQGTSKRNNTRDNRYIQGVEFDEFVEQLRELNDRDIDYIVSYDGKTGDKFIGKTLPKSLELTHVYINAGLSTQATLNGKNEITYESLYASKNLIKRQEKYEQMKLCFA
jgi:DNA adenine methylase